MLSLAHICRAEERTEETKPKVKPNARATEFFERKIRPLLVKNCYECHSEKAGEQQGGLLLDRRSGWIKGGSTEEAVLPGEPEQSLLIKAVRYTDDELQMPPDGRLSDADVKLLEQWVRLGAPGPRNDPGETKFSRLGNQEYLSEQAKTHWSFRPTADVKIPNVDLDGWASNPIDRFVANRLQFEQLDPSTEADPRTLIRRLSYDLTGLPPDYQQVESFVAECQTDRSTTVRNLVDQLIDSPGFGEHFARMWLDVARYGDTDGAYRPDTKTPHYFPFAFTYRDYVVNAFNQDKPFDQFVKEQLAADLMGFAKDAPERAALGFLTVGPHANRNPREAVDDWIDVTTRGLMGLTVACARCHDHKYEPVPTADYYSLHGVFSSVVRIHPLDEKKQPLISGYPTLANERADYRKKRAAIDRKIKNAAGKKSRGNNRSVAQKIRETELAELLLFHPGAESRAMVVKEAKKPVQPYIMLRGQTSARGDTVPRRFLKLLDQKQKPFPDDSSGRLELAEHIVDPQNPLTARVFVNRVWGRVMGSHLVQTQSDFGLQGEKPTHPMLLDWLANDFVNNDWSLKKLVRRIVLSSTYQQASSDRNKPSKIDSQNKLLWRSPRKHLSIEAIRDSMLVISGQLDATVGGRAEKLWDKDYTKRRALYGYINRFNLDPTLRAFDFPSPMQSQPGRVESIVPTQTLFTMNSPFVIDQAQAITRTSAFENCVTDEDRISTLFKSILQREPKQNEIERFQFFVERQLRLKATKNTDDAKARWEHAAQALLMSNEFQYVD